MIMDKNKQVLDGIRKTVQMGQSGIHSVMNAATRDDLRKALKSQLTEYAKIDQEAAQLQKHHGWKHSKISPAVEKMSSAMREQRGMAKMQLKFGDANFKIAGMMIQGNTRGMILGYKNRNKASHLEPQIRELSQTLLDTEMANISQMKPYL